MRKGVSNPAVVGTPGGGGGAGKATFSDLNYIKTMDAVSPRLVQILATGVHIPEAMLDLIDESGAYQRYRL